MLKAQGIDWQQKNQVMKKEIEKSIGGGKGKQEKEKTGTEGGM